MTVQVADFNRVERIDYMDDGHAVVVGYSPAGLPVTLDFGKERFDVHYDEHGSASYRVGSTGEVGMLDGQEGEDADRSTFYSRLSVLARDAHGGPQPDHGMLSFAETTWEPVVADPVERHVPMLRQLRQLLEVASSLLEDEAAPTMLAFDKPSNPVFQSLEYRSVNCCIPCYGYCGDPYGFYCEPSEPVRVCRAVSSFSVFNGCSAGIDQAVDPNQDTNGCSIPFNFPFHYKRQFAPSCNLHDVCYNTCQSGQRSCDSTFSDNMERFCQSYFDKHDCLHYAGVYYSLVRNHGQGPYEDAQVRHCHCCNME